MAGRAHDDAEGLIVRIDRGWSTVLIGDEEVRVMNVGADVAVGDIVVLDAGRERVASVLPRRTAIVRRASGEGQRAVRDVVAANVDVVFVVQASDLPTNPRRTERELALALDSGADVVLVANKCDLVGTAALAEVRRALEHAACGTPVLVVSAATGEGMDALRAACAGRTVALVGASGAGKSTMVNALVGGEVQRTGEVRAGDGRGRHTTTAAELIPLPGGGRLLDTPGLRSVALWLGAGGIERAFADVFALADGCRFRDCAHVDEPGCAVRGAVERGEIDAARVASMRQLVREEQELEEAMRSAR
jgi:ribosome biogenesis GTPase